MRNKDFAKIFVSNGTQVLVMTNESDEPNDADTPFKMTMITEKNGIRAAMSTCYKKVSIRNKEFKKCGQGNADAFYKSLSNFMTQD